MIKKKEEFIFEPLGSQLNIVQFLDKNPDGFEVIIDESLLIVKRFIKGEIKEFQYAISGIEPTIISMALIEDEVILIIEMKDILLSSFPQKYKFHIDKEKIYLKEIV